jgi:hypothetical protein
MSVGVAQYPRVRRQSLLGLAGTLSGALACVLAVGPARAAAQSEPVAPRLDLYVGAHYALGLGKVCQRDFDVDSCSDGEGFLGAHGLVLLRPFEHWSFGPSVAYSVTPSTASTSAGSFDSELSLLRVSAEARYWLSARRRSGLYLAAEAGLASMSETLSLNDRRDAPTLPSKSSVSQAAPLLGAGLGLSLALPFGLGLAPSVRAFATFFGDDPESFNTDLEAHQLGTLYWLALYVDGSFGFSL